MVKSPVLAYSINKLESEEPFKSQKLLRPSLFIETFSRMLKNRKRDIEVKTNTQLDRESQMKNPIWEMLFI